MKNFICIYLALTLSVFSHEEYSSIVESDINKRLREAGLDEATPSKDKDVLIDIYAINDKFIHHILVSKFEVVIKSYLGAAKEGIQTRVVFPNVVNCLGILKIAYWSNLTSTI